MARLAGQWKYCPLKRRLFARLAGQWKYRRLKRRLNASLNYSMDFKDSTISIEEMRFLIARLTRKENITVMSADQT